MNPAFGRFLRLKRARFGSLLLAVLAFVAVFADFFASDAPIVMTVEGNTYFLPAVTERERFGDRSIAEVAAMAEPDHAVVLPLLRVGPRGVAAGPPMAGPSLAHWLGTDAFGRDVLARVLHGTRVSLALGASVALMALVFGYVLGTLAGALGGVWDSAIERFVEIVGVFPAVVAVALVRALEQRPSLLSLVLVTAAVGGANIARLTRTLVLRALAEDWATAARALGASPARIAFVHVTPHLFAPLAVASVFAVASVALTETALSFLDLGVPATTVSWGEMLGEVRWGAGARILGPAVLALGLTLTALYLVADAIRKTFQNP
ncbi:MAG TPA: ABC transporter permease [Polyangiaceae bacterium]|nr:ABC transporter permease [Polyangiaceae bacterium]